MHSVICTGVQKAGTHLLWRAVQLLGVPKHPDQYAAQYRMDTNARFNRIWLDGGYAIHRHLPYEGKAMILGLTEQPVKFAVIIRHPKNILISRARRAVGIKRETIDVEEALMIHLGECGSGDSTLRPLFDPKRQLDWLGWLTDPDACVVRFEEFTGSRDDRLQALTRLNNYLDTTSPLTRHAIDDLVGESPTWSGENSVWQEYWTDTIEERFIEIGGYEVMQMFGYE